MKYDSLRKEMIRNGAILLGVLLLVIPIIAYCFMSQSALFLDSQHLKSDIGKIEADVKQTTNRLEEAKNSYEEYKQISSDKLPLDEAEVMDIPSRIREARKPLQTLKERYRLSSIDMSLTPPVALQGTMKKDSAGLVSSRVSLKFSAATDTLAMSFIDSLINEFPGYVRPITLNLTRSNDLNDAAMNQLRIGTIPQIVTGTFVFDWYKLEVNQPPAKPGGKS